MQSIRVAFRSIVLGACCVGAPLGAPIGAQSAVRASEPAPEAAARLDVTVGSVAASGSTLREESTWSMQAALTRRVARALRVGGAWTWRRGGGRSDICVLPSENSPSCLDRVPRQSQATLLLGTGMQVDGVDVDLVAGPALAFGEGRPLHGVMLGGDVGLGGEVFGFVVGYRFTTLRSRAGDRQQYRGPQLGVRVVF